MYEPPYVTYIQNLSDEDLVDIVKDLIGLRMTGCLNKDSKFRDCVSAVKDFFKDFESPQTSPDLIAEKVVKDEVFKRFVEIHDAQSRASAPNNIKTPYTNADKIRNMTDEELAKWLNYYAHDGYINPSCGWLKWLEQIVDQKRGM